MGNRNACSKGGSILVHVTYAANGKERPICLPWPCDSTVDDLEKKFLKTFSDLIPPQSSISDFEFSRYSGTHGDYIKLKADDVLHDGDIVKVVYLQMTLFLGPVVPHPVTAEGQYYIWTYFSSVLLKLDISSKKVKCDGTASDGLGVLHFKAINARTRKTPNALAFTLPGSTQDKVYVMKGQGENQDVIMEEMDENAVNNALPDDYKFECPQYFGDTLFRCYSGNDLYIAAMKDGSVTLQKGHEFRKYPKPNTLFLLASHL